MNKKEETVEELVEKMDQSSVEFRMLSGIDGLLLKTEKSFSVSEKVKGIIDGELTMFLTGQNSDRVMFDNLNQHLSVEVGPEKTEGLIGAVKDFIKEKGEYIPSAPSPVQVLASIKERLSQTSAIAPTKRDYSLERVTPASTDTPSEPKPIFDIYREPPTK